MAQAKKTKPEEKKQVVATNRKARMLYEILDTYEAGIALLGPEVKSLREGRAVLDGCYGREDRRELYLLNFHIPPYKYTSSGAPEPRRTRKLLLKRREIEKILGQLQTKGLTLVPLELYFKDGWAKVSLGLAKGKKGPDRRDDLKKRAAQRDAEKSFKGSYRG